MSIRLLLLFVWLLSAVCNAETYLPRKAWETSRVKGSPTPALPYKIEVAFPELKFRSPTSVTEVPGSRLMVTELGGKIFSFSKDRSTTERTLVADLASISGGHVALHHATPHPNFTVNRLVFVCLFHSDGKSRLSRFSVSNGDDFKILPRTEQVLLQWRAGGHGGGCLEFGTDGYLYVSTGDGSGPVPPDGLTTGQDVSDLLGAVLRIDVDQSDGESHYAVPADNPFVNAEGVRPEIWSFGLRNPWKFGIDPQKGNVFVADNGWETWELIHKLHSGSNCGWPIMEGRAPLRTDVPRGPTPITPPVKDHPHTEANSVVGGPIYRGLAFPDLDGTFVYGDYITGTIWGLDTDAGHAHRTLVDTDLHIVAFEEGSKGEIFFLDYDQTGMLYQLKRSEQQDTSAAFPRKLSETGIFRTVESLEPADGVVPYSVAAQPWSDGATARRWVAIPGDDRITLTDSETENSDFPDGTVLVKHLTLPRPGHSAGDRKLETQLLHFESGRWNPYAYLWNENGTDATLVDANGADVVVPETDDSDSWRTWHVGSVNECRLCHSAGAGFVVGFTAHQLRKAVGHAADPTDQVAALVSQHVLAASGSLGATDTPLVDPHDAAHSLSKRARSYLHANCGVCHHRRGPATISFFARADYPFDQLRITKRPGIGKFGLESPQLIKPGDPFRSVILYRMSKLGYGRMPYIGSRVVDSRGAALIADWVKSMPAPAGSPAPYAAEGSRAADAISKLAQNLAGASQSDVHIESLLESTEGALALATAIHRGDVAPSLTGSITAASKSKHSDVRGIFDHFVPESKRRRTLGPNPNAEQILLLAGDSIRGEQVFRSENSRCSTCHDVSNASESIGPTLREMRRMIKRPELLLHIVQPSQRVDEKYATWTVVTTDGRSESGLMVSNENGTVRLRKADRSILTIKRTEIESMEKSPQSLMPNGLLSDMTAQQAADLLAFLIDKTRS